MSFITQHLLKILKDGARPLSVPDMGIYMKIDLLSVGIETKETNNKISSTLDSISTRTDTEMTYTGIEN